MMQVFCLGEKDRPSRVSTRLENYYQKISGNQRFPLRSHFSYGQKAKWREILPKNYPALIFYEVTSKSNQAEIDTITAIKRANPACLWVLIIKSKEDFFEIAGATHIGNILQNNLFDYELILSLTIRLMSGNIFGFEPYFSNGYKTTPREYKISGPISIKGIMDFFEEKFLSQIDSSQHFRLKTYFYEVLVNTIAYTVVNISPKDRDAGNFTFPSETFAPEERSFTISMAADKRKCAFAIRDSAGTLNRERILEKLRRQFVFGSEKHPPGILDFTGRGLFLILKDNQLMANIHRDRWAEIIFLHYYTKKPNKYSSLMVTEIGG